MKKQAKRNGRGAGKRYYEIVGIILIAVGIFGLISLVGLDVGIAGSWMRTGLRYAFGMGAFFPALVCILAGWHYLYRHIRLQISTRDIVWLNYFLLAVTVLHWWYVIPGEELRPDYFTLYGGLVGAAGLLCLRTLFGEMGVRVALATLFIINTVVLTNWTLADGMRFVGRKAKPHWDKASERVKAHRERETETKRSVQPPQFFDFGGEKKHDSAAASSPAGQTEKADETALAGKATPLQYREQDTALPPEPDWAQPPAETDTASVKPDLAPTPVAVRRKDYRLPSPDLLQKTKQSRGGQQEVRDNVAKIEGLLASFGVEAKVIHASRGPAVTRYELEPGPGVKVSRIVNLADDIALQLAATDVRIEAPIPGKAAVGIEVPNREVAAVGLREVLTCEEFQHAVGGVVVGLGMDITGRPVVTDLAKMPHLLIAGSTGSGKSVCINTLIASILYRNYPDEVKLILIDPKVVELAQYSHIPHLMTPVVTDAKKAAGVLRWAVREMENRYRLFASAKARNIVGYNEMHPDSKLPLVVIIIDELADLMMVAPADVEDAIARLAQMARAAGLHLVLATQRPSVDVITGTIKANILSRISFAVSSQVDSRTILDMAGAEKLLGKGDMLFYPVGAPKPRRVQGAFISDGEVEALVEYIRKQGTPDYHDDLTRAQESEPNGETPLWDDELLEDAVRMVVETGQASVSMLQRRFRIGYTRAGRLIDTMESMGIVGPSLGSKAREILLTEDAAMALFEKEEGGTTDGTR